MIAISIVAGWLVVSLAVGVLFGTAMRKARGEESAIPALPAAQVRYLSNSKSGTVGGTVAATGHRKQATKHHAAA